MSETPRTDEIDRLDDDDLVRRIEDGYSRLERELTAARAERDRMRHGATVYSAALGRIDYLCGEPNEMECSAYDVHKDETAVIKAVEKLKAERDALRVDAERIASLAWPSPFCDEYGGVDIHQQASVYASAFGRKEANRDDYIAAVRDAIDAARKEPK
jgi:hypothetical protein